MGHALSTVFPFAPLKLLSDLKPTPYSWKLNKPWIIDHHFSNLEIGKIGEDIATQYVKTLGYKVLYRNFSPSRGGEIDLICRNSNTLVFIEVKTRVNALYRPILAVDKNKRKYMQKGATQYLNMLDPTPAYRFDVIEVLLQPELLPECFLTRDIAIHSPF